MNICRVPTQCIGGHTGPLSDFGSSVHSLSSLIIIEELATGPNEIESRWHGLSSTVHIIQSSLDKLERIFADRRIRRAATSNYAAQLSTIGMGLPVLRGVFVRLGKSPSWASRIDLELALS